MHFYIKFFLQQKKRKEIKDGKDFISEWSKKETVFNFVNFKESDLVLGVWQNVSVQEIYQINQFILQTRVRKREKKWINMTSLISNKLRNRRKSFLLASALLLLLNLNGCTPNKFDDEIYERKGKFLHIFFCVCVFIVEYSKEFGSFSLIR